MKAIFLIKKIQLIIHIFFKTTNGFYVPAGALKAKITNRRYTVTKYYCEFSG
jgi:hypothetical protein